MSALDPTFYTLSEKLAALKYSDLLPHNENSQRETREFLQKVIDILLDYVELCFNRDEPVLDFHQPKCLKKAFDMQLQEEGLTLYELVQDCVKTLKYQVKSGHLRFMNQLANGIDVFAMAGEWLMSSQNSCIFSYEVAPVFVLMEEVVMKRIRDLIGYEKGDSTLVPGGKICNLQAVSLARFKMFPDSKEQGMSAVPGKLVVFTSDQNHHTIRQSCGLAGIGTESCTVVKSDFGGRMIPDELEKQINEAKQAGLIPLMVVATAGTEVFGSFDPIIEIADICEKQSIWLHVDACWGGGLLLSKKHRDPYLTGIARADSVTWSPHKLMGTQMHYATFHVKQEDLLVECNKSAGYSAVKEKNYDEQIEPSDQTIQCGRQNDIFKLWFQWRSRGDAGLEARMNRLMELSAYLVQKIKERSDKFHLLQDPPFVNICFWYIPKRLRGAEHNAEKMEAMGLLCSRIKSRMMKAGSMMIGYTQSGKPPNFFRAIISQEGTKEQDVDFMLDEIDRLGEDL